MSSSTSNAGHYIGDYIYLAYDVSGSDVQHAASLECRYCSHVQE